jgi:hypothetical protein
MEALIGFAVGYWLGTRHGRQGLDRALEQARGIWESPEARHLVGEGLSALQAVAPNADVPGKGGRGTRAAVIRSVIDKVIEGRSERKAAAA